MIPQPDFILSRLRDFQRTVRDLVLHSRSRQDLHQVHHASSADTIYQIDTLIEPILIAFCEDLAKTIPLVLIAEGLVDETGREGLRIFPAGTREEDATIRLIVDPIDGTRGLMYDKRSAWALAGVAPNNGPATRLRDIELAIMTELPTSKMAFSDVLWATQSQGAQGIREPLFSEPRTLNPEPLPLRPSPSPTISHGFAMISNFFPGTKVLASQLMEYLVQNLIGPADVTKATVFEDQYISTAGQFYELIVGHDRFNADLRSHFYRLQHQPPGLCCHPYDAATALIAEEAGVILTDGLGNPLDGPLDTTTGLSWAGFANAELRNKIEPLLTRFLGQVGPRFGAQASGTAVSEP